MPTRSQRIQERAKKLRSGKGIGGGSIQGEYMAGLLEKGTQDASKAAFSKQQKADAAVTAVDTAQKSSAGAMQTLAEAAMTGDRSALSGAASQIQQGTQNAAYQGALAGEQASAQAVQAAEQEKQAAQQAAIQEQVRKRQQTMSDISSGLEIATQVAQLAAPGAFGLIDNITNLQADNATAENDPTGGSGSGSKVGGLIGLLKGDFAKKGAESVSGVGDMTAEQLMGDESSAAEALRRKLGISKENY